MNPSDVNRGVASANSADTTETMALVIGSVTSAPDGGGTVVIMCSIISPPKRFHAGGDSGSLLSPSFALSAWHHPQERTSFDGPDQLALAHP